MSYSLSSKHMPNTDLKASGDGDANKDEPYKLLANKLLLSSVTVKKDSFI